MSTKRTDDKKNYSTLSASPQECQEIDISLQKWNDEARKHGWVIKTRSNYIRYILAELNIISTPIDKLMAPFIDSANIPDDIAISPVSLDTPNQPAPTTSNSHESDALDGFTEANEREEL